MKLLTLGEIISGVESIGNNFLYLVGYPDWYADTLGTIYYHQTDDDFDKSWLLVAQDYGLQLVFDIATLQDIKLNCIFQKPNVTIDEIAQAVNYYYMHDVFMHLG